MAIGDGDGECVDRVGRQHGGYAVDGVVRKEVVGGRERKGWASA